MANHFNMAGAPGVGNPIVVHKLEHIREDADSGKPIGMQLPLANCSCSPRPACINGASLTKKSPKDEKIEEYLQHSDTDVIFLEHVGGPSPKQQNEKPNLSLEPKPVIGPVPPMRRTPYSRNPSSGSDCVHCPCRLKHPAQFLGAPDKRPYPLLDDIPPKPSLEVSLAPDGVFLIWNMKIEMKIHANISKYEFFCYPETNRSFFWRKIGVAKAVRVPIKCNVTGLLDGIRYYFMIRAIDVHKRFGPYSNVVSLDYRYLKGVIRSVSK